MAGRGWKKSIAEVLLFFKNLQCAIAMAVTGLAIVGLLLQGLCIDVLNTQEEAGMKYKL